MALSRFPLISSQTLPELTRVQANINSVLEPVATAVNATPLNGGPLPAWIVPSRLGLWTWPAGGGVRYHKDALGYVHLQIHVTNATGGALSGNIFQLPLGFRSLWSLTQGVVTDLHSLVSVGINGGSVSVAGVPNGDGVQCFFDYLGET